MIGAGRADYRRLIDSGLYHQLVERGLIVRHEELPGENDDGIVLHPQQIPMISYPYEWCLAQLRDAALLTLQVQRLALAAGMVLKDASAYNVQFLDGRPVLIDTLSFVPHRNGPWPAYRQFCQHFLAPLLVGATHDPALARMASVFIDGLPLPLASSLLSRHSFLRAGPLFHIHLHAAAEGRQLRAATTVEPPKTSKHALEALIDSLERAVRSVSWPTRSKWSNYYDDPGTNPSGALEEKLRVVTGWIERLQPATVWDLGANTGLFSTAAAERGAQVVAFDADPACVEAIYADVRAKQVTGLLPLVLDLANPSAAIGWSHQERMSLETRGPADMLLGLALTHHLAIGNNVPFDAIAAYFARLAGHAIVEFIPRDDPRIQAMVRGREMTFEHYHQRAFEEALARHFSILESVTSEATGRVLYLLRQC